MIQNRIIPYLGYLLNGYVIFKPESVGSTSEKDYHGKCTVKIATENVGQSKTI